MSVHASVHVDDDADVMFKPLGTDRHGVNRGYVRLTPDPERIVSAVAIHSDAAGFRRIAVACLTLADQLDPATKEPAA